MDIYFWGQLSGRLLAAYIIALLIALACNRFRWSAARRRLHSPMGITAVIALFAIPLMVSASRIALNSTP